jgi:hypothetical protein
MSAIAQFVADPKAFLRSNLLRCLWAGDPLRPRCLFSFKKRDKQAIRLSDRTLIDVYNVIPLSESDAATARKTAGAKNSTYLEAYFCPYGNNAICSITVDSQADFMFTTNMDGCAFGVGSESGDKTQRVGHVNLRDSAPHAHELQLEALKADGLNKKTVDPERYMHSSKVVAEYGEVKATTIGIRDTAAGKWSFVYQQYREDFKTQGLTLVTLKLP